MATIGKCCSLLMLALLVCFSLAEADLDTADIALRRILNSEEFKTALSNGDKFLMGTDNMSSVCVENRTRPFNNTGSLMQYLDAIGKPHSAISLGNLALLGSFDTCQLDLNNAHYCISKINFVLKGVSSGTHNYTVFPVQWGGCFPKSCQPSDLAEIFNDVLAIVNPVISNKLVISYTNGTVCPVKPEYTTDVKITLAFCGLLLLLCLLGTIVDLFKDPTDKPSTTQSPPLLQESVMKQNNSADVSSLSYIRDFNQHTTDINAPLTPNGLVINQPKRKRPTRRGCLDFLTCFSILRNTTRIFDTKVPSVAITSVNGVRVISMFWVILGHTFLFFLSSSLMQNPTRLLSDATTFSMMVIVNGYFSVDSFFFISGLLLAYTAFRKLEKNNGRFNWALFYIHRYFRLTPSLMFVILFYTKLLPYLNYSPLWAQHSDKLCGQYWWTNLLYINNFYPTEFLHECLGWSWYLANDMQFFVVTPLFLIVTYRYRWRGLLASAGSALLISSITIASLYGYYNIDAMALGKFDTAHLFSDELKSDFENIIYVKPYCRIQPYLIGFSLGYYMHRCYSGTKKPGWMLASLFWVIAIATGMSLVYAPHNTTKEHGRTWSTAENIIYGTSEKLLWGVALAWVTYACHNGYGGLIQRFLSARFWIPLSRLTYSAYLVHPIVLAFMFSGAKSTMFYSYTTICYHYISAVVLSYGCAFILAVSIEFPCDNLENLAMKLSRKRLL